MIAASILFLGGLSAFFFLSPTAPPPPPEIASDPFLMEGRELYLSRCVSCHGVDGRGRGEIAGTLKSGRAGNLTTPPWKYGDRPEDVLRIVAQGTPDGQMPGWAKVFSPGEQRAVAAYALILGNRPIPDSIRPKASPDAPR